jgi:hypothetical protein
MADKSFKLLSIYQKIISQSGKVFAAALIILFVLSPGLVKAGFYFELDFESGGDTLASASGNNSFLGDYERDLDIGGGGKLAIGIHNILGESKNRSLSFALGHLSDSIDASNGDADYDTVTFDAIYRFHFESHRFGLGASYHIDPEYKEKIDGQPRIKAEFDDALGLVMQYSYALSPVFHVGLRYTEMDYEINDVELDASSFGIFMALNTL